VLEITAQKQLLKKTTHGFIINAKDNLTQAGGTATFKEELMKNNFVANS